MPDLNLNEIGMESVLEVGTAPVPVLSLKDTGNGTFLGQRTTVNITLALTRKFLYVIFTFFQCDGAAPISCDTGSSKS